MIALPNIGGLVKVGKVFMQARRPEILLGTSIVAQISAMALAAKAGWDSRGQVIIAEVDKGEALTPKEIAVLTWPNYLKPAAAGVVAVGSTAGLHLVHVKDKKALVQTGLAALEEVKQSAEDYKADVEASLEENLTAKQKEKVDAAIHEKVERRPNEPYNPHTYLVREMRTGREEWTTQLRVDQAMLAVNNILQNDDCTINEFYSLAGFDHLPDGEQWGWSPGIMVGLEWDTTSNHEDIPVRTFTFQPGPEALKPKK